MKLQGPYVAVLKSLSMFPIGAHPAHVMKNIPHNECFWTERRIFHILDVLQTEKMVQRIRLWPSAGGGIMWALTQKGVQCLTQAHHH